MLDKANSAAAITIVFIFCRPFRDYECRSQCLGLFHCKVIVTFGSDRSQFHHPPDQIFVGVDLGVFAMRAGKPDRGRLMLNLHALKHRMLRFGWHKSRQFESASLE